VQALFNGPEDRFIFMAVIEDMDRFGRRLTPESHDELYGQGAYDARYGGFDEPEIEMERLFDAHFGAGAYHAHRAKEASARK